MENLKPVTTIDGRKIVVDISANRCSSYGFLHNEVATNRNELEVRMEGVGPNAEGDDTMYYEILNNKKTAGLVCCYEKLGNLRQYGFQSKQ